MRCETLRARRGVTHTPATDDRLTTGSPGWQARMAFSAVRRFTAMPLYRTRLREAGGQSGDLVGTAWEYVNQVVRRGRYTPKDPDDTHAQDCLHLARVCLRAGLYGCKRALEQVEGRVQTTDGSVRFKVGARGRDTLLAENHGAPDPGLEGVELRDQATNWLARFRPRVSRLLTLAFGLGGGPALGIGRAASALGISKQLAYRRLERAGLSMSFIRLYHRP